MKRLLAAVDTDDVLLLVGLCALIGGIAALSRPAAAIVFGSLCLGFWIRKTWSAR